MKSELNATLLFNGKGNSEASLYLLRLANKDNLP